jgi:hypothetical protein
MTVLMCSSCGERPAKYRSPRRGKVKADREHDLCIPCAASHTDMSHASLLVLKEREAATARNEGAVHTILALLRAAAFTDELEEALWDWIHLNSLTGAALTIRGESIYPPPVPTSDDLSTTGT